jgi:putative flippase GtrA
MLNQNNLIGQLVRYGISGVGVTLIFTAVYEAVLRFSTSGPQIANTLAFMVAVVIGYIIHSRWSFRDHGSRDAPARSTTRFLIINLIGFALNSFWVWLIATRLGFSPRLPLVPIVTITPWLSFWLNRRWTFG